MLSPWISLSLDRIAWQEAHEAGARRAAKEKARSAAAARQHEEREAAEREAAAELVSVREAERLSVRKRIRKRAADGEGKDETDLSAVEDDEVDREAKAAAGADEERAGGAAEGDDAARGSAPPILVLCQTNHALDQFLEGILEFEPRVVRIGGRSQSEVRRRQLS